MNNCLYNSTLYVKSSKKILPWRKSTQDQYSQSRSLNIKIDDKTKLILTTNHSITHNSRKIYHVTSNSFINEESTDSINKLKLIRRSKISDLALLGFGSNIKRNIIDYDVNNRKSIQFLSLKKISKKIPSANSELYISVGDTINGPTEIRLVFDKMEFNYINGSKDLPPTPILTSNIVSSERSELNGLSGSPVFNTKNKVIGIVSQYNKLTNQINIVPSYLIHKIVNDYLENRKEKVLGLVIPVESNEDGLIISKNCSRRIRKGDKITKINYKNIDSNCMVYSQEIKHRLPWNTFIMTLYNDETISILIKSKSDTGKSNYTFPIRKRLKHLNDYLKIDNIFKEDFEVISGYVFCELTFPLIKLFFENKVILHGPSIDIINRKNKSPKSNKTVVMIDYLGSEREDIFEGAINNNFNQKEFQNKKIFSLNKLGNKKIKNLSHLKLLMKRNKNKFLSLEYDQKKYIKVGY